MRSLKIILLIVLVLVIFCSVVLLQQKEKPKSVASITSQKLSTQEYVKIRDELVKILLEKDPRAALSTLWEKAQTNQAIARSCHGLVHEIGHVAYEKYGDFGEAMQYQDEMCNSGYLHGIIESHFKNSQDIIATVKTVCHDYSEENFIGWQCFHGVGHGLMYFTDNDLPKSLSLCETLTNSFAKSGCVNGVFMENFNVDQKLHISKYVKITDPFYPCTEQKKEYKGDCYLYAPTFYLSIHNNNYTETLNWCKTAEKDFRLVCISGVGSQAIKENITSPKVVESICMDGTKEETNACISGMVGLYLNHFGGVKETKELCTKLEKTNQPICQQTISTRETLF